jgi:hypothetical protein
LRTDDDDPFPEESYFVASYRDNIPGSRARVTTATFNGRAILRGGRGRSKGRGRGRGVSVDTVAARGRGARSGSSGTRARNRGTRGTMLGTTGRRARVEEAGPVEQPLTDIPARGRGRKQWLLWAVADPGFGKDQG